MKFLFVFVCLVVVFLIRALIKKVKYDSVNFSQRLPVEEYQLIEAIKSGRKNSLMDVGNHLLMIGQQMQPECAQPEVYTACEAALGFIFMSLKFNQNWSNGMIYSCVNDHLNMAKESFTRKNIDVFDRMYQDMLFYLIGGESHEILRNQFQEIHDFLHEILIHPERLNNVDDREEYSKLLDESIGTVCMAMLTSAAEVRNDYMRGSIYNKMK